MTSWWCFSQAFQVSALCSFQRVQIGRSVFNRDTWLPGIWNRNWHELAYCCHQLISSLSTCLCPSRIGCRRQRAEISALQVSHATVLADLQPVVFVSATWSQLTTKTMLVFELQKMPRALNCQNCFSALGRFRWGRVRLFFWSLLWSDV